MDWPSGVHFLASVISKSDPTRLFPVGLCERWSLCSTNAYNPEQLEGSNMNSECKNWSVFIAKCLAWSQISSWCVQGSKWRTYWTFTGNEKDFLSYFSQWCEFNFCVAIIFLPINLCSHSHHFKSPSLLFMQTKHHSNTHN